MALSTPNRDKVYVLLHNPHSKSDIRAEFSIFEYTENEDGWTMYVNPNYSEFEHIEDGLSYINQKFEKFLPGK